MARAERKIDMLSLLSDYCVSDGAKVMMLIIALAPDGKICARDLEKFSNKSRASVHRYCRELKNVGLVIISEQGCKGTLYQSVEMRCRVVDSDADRLLRA